MKRTLSDTAQETNHGGRLIRLALQKGQSTTEFVVFLVVLVPLFLMLPLLGKYSDINQAAIRASRYAAWERTVSPPSAKSDAQIAAEARRRFFGNTSTFIKTGDIASDDVPEHRNPMWKDHRQGQLLKSFDDITVSSQESQTPGNKARATRTLIRGLRTAAVASAGDFDLDTNGLYRADVQVNVADVADLEPLDNIGLVINRHNVILADGWDASSKSQTKDRVQGLMPGSELARAIKAGTSIVEPIFPELKEYEPGCVKPDVVPNDRLSDSRGYDSCQ